MLHRQQQPHRNKKRSNNRDKKEKNKKKKTENEIKRGNKLWGKNFINHL